MTATSPIHADVPEVGMGGDMAMAKMGINASPKQVHPGPVTFKVTKLSSKIAHAVIVARLPDGMDKMQAVGSVNEISPSQLAAP